MDTSETIFLVAISLICAATIDTDRVLESGRGEFAAFVFRYFWFLRGLNGLAYLACFISGFFLLPWWFALLALPISWVGGATLAWFLHPIFAPLYLLAGVIATILAFL